MADECEQRDGSAEIPDPQSFNEHNAGVRRVMLLAAAAGSLGYALQRRDGLFEPAAFVFLTASLICAVIAPWLGARTARAPAPGHPAAGGWIIIFPGLLIGWQFAQMFLAEHPGSLHAPSAGRAYFLLVGIFAAFALAMMIALLTGRERIARRVFFPLFLAAFLLLGGWWLRSVPHPFTDVWEAQRVGLEAAAAGKSPFDAPFPDVYDYPPAYSPGTVVRDGMVELGFPYPPLSLFLDLPGHWLAGDFRYADLFYITAAAALIGYARPGPLPILAAALFLTTGRTLFVLEWGFTEAGMVFLLALLVFAACRRWRIAPVLLGLLFASKQYLIAAAPCALLLIPPPFKWRKVIRWAAAAVAAALIVSLPLILLDHGGFMRSAILPSLRAHFRYDSLSYPALFASFTGHAPPSSPAFLFAAGGLALGFWNLPRSVWGFCMSAALVLMPLFAFSSGAFCNYYYFIIALFCSAIAAQNVPPLPADSGENPYDAPERRVRRAAVRP